VFLIDSDLEEEPELLGKFWEELHKEDDLDVVFGVQESRKGGWFEKNSGEAFYKVFNFLSPTKVTANQTTVRILTSRFIKAISDNLKERNLFLAGNLEALGFKQKTIEIKKQKRQGSNYTFIKKIQLMINSITSFSSKPLVYVFYLGSFISFFSFAYIAYLLIMRLFFGQPLVGWTSMIVSVWFISFINFFSLSTFSVILIILFFTFSSTAFKFFILLSSLKFC
jgi:putative glycosyltransferase